MYDGGKEYLTRYSIVIPWLFKEELTELDVHHRILRFNNYFVSMVNKSLLPLRLNIPLVGDYVFLRLDFKALICLLYSMPTYLNTDLSYPAVRNNKQCLHL